MYNRMLKHYFNQNDKKTLNMLEMDDKIMTNEK